MQRFCGEMVHVWQELLKKARHRLVGMIETSHEDCCKRFLNSCYRPFFLCSMDLIVEAMAGVL